MSVRLAAVGGAIFFALLAVFAVLTNGSPSASDSGRETFDFIAAHDGRLQLAAVAFGLAMPAALLLLLLAALYRALREAEGESPGLAVAALSGGVLAAAGTAVGALVMGVTASRIADIGPAGAHVWWTMFLMSIGATLLGLLLATGATGVVGLETGLFPRWFSIASIVLAVVSIAGAVTIGYPATGIQATAGIAVILDSVWILLVGLYLWREPELALPRRDDG